MGLFSRRQKVPGAKAAPADLRGDPLAPASPSPAAKPATPPHILQKFDKALEGLVTKTVEMGAHVAGMVRRACPAFVNRDASAATEIIQADIVVDREKEALLQAVVQALARHGPVASDLRLILAVEHIASNLERAADHAKNIAKRALPLAGGPPLDPTARDLLNRLYTEVLLNLEDALRAFERGDQALAADVLRRDSEPDALYDDMFHAAIAKLRTGTADAAVDVHTLFVGKSLERIGDHATNIAEEVRFLARGDIPSATRTE